MTCECDFAVQGEHSPECLFSAKTLMEDVDFDTFIAVIRCHTPKEEAEKMVKLVGDLRETADAGEAMLALNKAFVGAMTTAERDKLRDRYFEELDAGTERINEIVALRSRVVTLEKAVETARRVLERCSLAICDALKKCMKQEHDGAIYTSHHPDCDEARLEVSRALYSQAIGTQGEGK